MEQFHTALKLKLKYPGQKIFHYTITIPWVATYYCTLEGCIISGTTYGNLLVDVEDEIITPIEFELSQNYPNPFNPSTKIKFALPLKTNVVISIYNSIGEKVAEAFRGDLETGYHEVDFNAERLSSGVYIYRIESEKFVSSKKMLLLK